MSTVHLILQGKGGVGKSMIAAMLAQYKIENNETPLCVDTDPVNNTLAGFASLNATLVDLMEGDKINARNFDKLIELISETPDDVIVDNGASSFVPLSAYIVNNQVPEILTAMGKRLIVHTVITGGQALLDTLNGFNQTIRQFPDECEFVVWLNPYWGAIEYKEKKFEEMKVYQEHHDKLLGIVEIPVFDKDTFGQDFSDMLKAKRTFLECEDDINLHIMVRQRLKIIKRKIYAELNKFNGRI